VVCRTSVKSLSERIDYAGIQQEGELTLKFQGEVKQKKILQGLN
jgi:hypothetical protein